MTTTGSTPPWRRSARASGIFGAHDPRDPELDKAAKVLVQDPPAASGDRLALDYYYWYYGTLALNQIDGPDSPRRTGRYWPSWNRALTEAVLPLQDRAPRSCTNGGWLEPDRWGFDDGPLYATAINVLTLEVNYRYENAFGGKKRK